jgi:AcrR family transcriptional regulator
MNVSRQGMVTAIASADRQNERNGMPGSSTNDRDTGSKTDRSMTRSALEGETRGERRRRRNRQALIEAGYQVMTQKGIDAATMSEITELADVGAGTVYNYFASKDELAMCIMEQVMDRLSQRIEAVTNNFTDPAQVYAFGIRNVMIAATTDQRWRWLLRRSEVIAGAMYRVMGPYAIRDIRHAVLAGRYRVEDPELAWRQATHAIVGFSMAVCDKNILPGKMDEAVVNLLGMVGVRRGEAWEIARRPCPELPSE